MPSAMVLLQTPRRAKLRRIGSVMPTIPPWLDAYGHAIKRYVANEHAFLSKVSTCRAPKPAAVSPIMASEKSACDVACKAGGRCRLGDCFVHFFDAARPSRPWKDSTQCSK